MMRNLSLFLLILVLVLPVLAQDAGSEPVDTALETEMVVEATAAPELTNTPSPTATALPTEPAPTETFTPTPTDEATVIVPTSESTDQPVPTALTELSPVPASPTPIETMTATPVETIETPAASLVCQIDIDQDGHFSVQDMSIIQGAYLHQPTDETSAVYDLNQNGQIDIGDLQRMTANLFEICVD